MTEQTPEQQDQLAEYCAQSPLAYRDFVLALTSPPETYNLSQEVLGGLIEALNRLTPASLELDHFKRAMTYGEKLRINPPAQYHPIHPLVLGAAARIKDGDELTEFNRARLLLIHALLGKITENLELAPILISLISDKADVDMVNLIEELGDDKFYTAMAEHAGNVMEGNVVYRNVRKLCKRYKGGLFDQAAALNRDLDAEREALGGEPQPQ